MECPQVNKEYKGRIIDMDKMKGKSGKDSTNMFPKAKRTQKQEATSSNNAPLSGMVMIQS